MIIWYFIDHIYNFHCKTMYTSFFLNYNRYRRFNLIVMRELNGTNFFHRICVWIRLISLKLAHIVVSNKHTIFAMGCTVAPRSFNRFFVQTWNYRPAAMINDGSLYFTFWKMRKVTEFSTNKGRYWPKFSVFQMCTTPNILKNLEFIKSNSI